MTEVLSVAENRKRKKAALKQKEIRFIDAYVENGENATQAVFDAKIPVKTIGSARVTGKYYKDKLMPQIIDKKMALIDKMDAKGLNDDMVVERHKAIIEEGSDRDALTGIKMYYDKKYTDDKGGSGDNVINITFGF
jgi:hypothetical protein